MAALFQCLVEHLDAVLDRDGSLPIPRQWVVRENKWRAARHGLEAQIIVDDKGELIALRQSIANLVSELTPIAERLRCAEELAAIFGILDRGPSYSRQRDVAARGSLQDVVDSMVAELRSDQPTARPPA